MTRYTSTNDDKESALQKEYMTKAAAYVADLEKILGRKPLCCVTTFGCQMNFASEIEKMLYYAIIKKYGGTTYGENNISDNDNFSSNNVIY